MEDTAFGVKLEGTICSVLGQRRGRSKLQMQESVDMIQRTER